VEQSVKSMAGAYWSDYPK